MVTCGNFDIATAPSVLCGEVESPLPIWLTTTMNHRSGSRARPGPTYTRSQVWWVPENQVGTRMALSRASLRVPYVATASWRSGMVPPSSRSRSPMP